MIELMLKMDDVERLYTSNNLKVSKLINLNEIKRLLLAEYVMNIVDMRVAPEGHIVIKVQESGVK